jgi:pseudaminic acid cytidylyltransferase
MKNLAIIPARGGSKRIPRKNIRDFMKKPIIAYSIEMALKTGLFDEVMVSTEDEEIATVAKQYGATVPFIRSMENADDFATTAVVIDEVLNKYKVVGKNYDYACCLYPTTPLLNVESIEEGFRILLEENFDTVFPVVKYSDPIWRSLKLEDGRVGMNWPEHLNSRSQDLQAAYHDAGCFYWIHVERFQKQKVLFTQNSGVLTLTDLEVQDINCETDWKLAELKYKLINNLE